MKTKRCQLLFLVAGMFIFAGCFETQFSFDTIVKKDGTVLRESRIDGRGANLFKSPEGGGWKSKTWETKGDETFLANTYYHILAKGNFSPGQPISPDFRLDVEKLLNNMGESGKKRLETLGIKPPYGDQLVAANDIKIYQVQGWFTTTTIYEETFKTAGIIPILLRDLETEIKKSYLPEDHLGENPPDFSQMAFDRLEKEILPRFEFRVRVSLPGKIISTNAIHTQKHTVAWIFTLRDFKGDYSNYVLKVSSRAFRGLGLITLGIPFLIAILLILLVVIGVGRLRKAKRAKRPSVKDRPAGPSL